MANIKIGKLTIVILLTVLIWVWVDLALEEELPLSRIPISATNTDPTLWMSFLDKNKDPINIFHINELILKGPASAIREFEHQRAIGTFRLVLFLSPERFAGEAGQHVLPLLEFLRQSESIREMGLTVESCTPSTVDIDIVKRIPTDLNIRCVDENGMVIKAQIDPVRIEMDIPENWGIDKRVAEVVLTSEQYQQAATTPIEIKPYIVMDSGQRIEADKMVSITTPPKEENLKIHTINNVKLGFLMGPHIEPKYHVDVKQLHDIISFVKIRATEAAKEAYEKNMQYHVILQIDEDTTEPQQKQLKYNFPLEFVRKNEIYLDQEPVMANFTLIPLSHTSDASTADTIESLR